MMRLTMVMSALRYRGREFFEAARRTVTLGVSCFVLQFADGGGFLFQLMSRERPFKRISHHDLLLMVDLVELCIHG